MATDDDPMAYLAKMKAKMAGLAEMQEVAAQQMAIANNVKARMAKVEAENAKANKRGGRFAVMALVPRDGTGPR